MISTHILDTSKGSPAGGIVVRLQKKDTSNLWKDVVQGVTNEDGRFSFGCDRVQGVYQIVFEIEDYVKKDNKDYFFLNTPVIFKIEDVKRNYHVPLLLNPFGYSTYRGS